MAAMPRIPSQQNSFSPRQQRARQAKRHKQRSQVAAVIAAGGGTGKRKVVDPISGEEYVSHKSMLAARKNRATQIRLHFAEMVRVGTLGQEPWEQLPGETTVQFDRFLAYLRLPISFNGTRPFRDLIDLCHASEAVLNHTRTRWYWVLRAALWDKEQERLDAEQFRLARTARIRKQAKLGEKMQDLAMRGIDNNLRTSALDLSPADIARIADVGVKIERLARGDSTSNEASKSEIHVVWDGPTPPWASSPTPTPALPAPPDDTHGN